MAGVITVIIITSYKCEQRRQDVVIAIYIFTFIRGEQTNNTTPENV